MSRQAKLKCQTRQQQQLQNTVLALQVCISNALQAVLSSFIVISNIPAMPMTCSQVTHKSSGFFISSLPKKTARQCCVPLNIGGCDYA